MPGVLVDHHAGERAEAGAKGGAQQTVRAPLLQDMNVLLQRAAYRRRGRRYAGAGQRRGRRVSRCRYRRDEPVTSMDAVLEQAYAPKKFRNGERPPDSACAAIRTLSFSGGAAQVDATYITPMEHHNPMEPHATIARWDGDRLTVWTATQGISGAQATLAATVRHRSGECARDLSLCRRWLRLQGQYLAAGHACRDGGEGGRPAGEAGGDACADVHVQRLSSAHHPEAALCRR